MDRCSYIQWKNQQESSILELLVEKYHRRDWSWSALSRNPNISWEFIQTHPNFPWNYTYVSSNPNITWDIVQNYPRLKWNYSRLAKNPNFTWNIISSRPDCWGELKYTDFSENPNLTWELVNNNLDKRWNWSMLACHSNITWDILSTNLKLLSYTSCVSANRNITPEIVEANPEYKWNWDILALSNPHLTETTLRNLNGNIAKNPNMTWELIKDLPSSEYWYDISAHPNITIDTIMSNTDKPWKIDGIARNPHLTIEFIENNIYTLSFHELSFNLFSFEPQLYTKTKEADIALRKHSVKTILNQQPILYNDLITTIIAYVGYE